MLYWFLPYIDINQLCICPLPLEPSLPSHPIPSHPRPPLLVVTEHQVELPVLYTEFPLAIYFTRGTAYVSTLLSPFVPLSFPHCVHKSVLCVCVSIAAVQIGSSVPFF